MRKAKEISSEFSCLNKAEEDEMLFVLLGRDAAAARTVRFWVSERIALGKNQHGDLQIVEALRVADAMEKECKK